MARLFDPECRHWKSRTHLSEEVMYSEKPPVQPPFPHRHPEGFLWRPHFFHCYAVFRFLYRGSADKQCLWATSVLDSSVFRFLFRCCCHGNYSFIVAERGGTDVVKPAAMLPACSEFYLQHNCLLYITASEVLLHAIMYWQQTWNGYRSCPGVESCNDLFHFPISCSDHLLHCLAEPGDNSVQASDKERREWKIKWVVAKFGPWFTASAREFQCLSCFMSRWNRHFENQPVPCDIGRKASEYMLMQKGHGDAVGTC